MFDPKFNLLFDKLLAFVEVVGCESGQGGTKGVGLGEVFVRMGLGVVKLRKRNLKFLRVKLLYELIGGLHP